MKFFSAVSFTLVLSNVVIAAPTNHVAARQAELDARFKFPPAKDLIPIIAGGAGLITAISSVIPNIIKAAKGNKRELTHELLVRELEELDARFKFPAAKDLIPIIAGGAGLVTAISSVIPNIIKAVKGDKRELTHELLVRELQELDARFTLPPMKDLIPMIAGGAGLITAISSVIPKIISAAKGDKRDLHEVLARELAELDARFKLPPAKDLIPIISGGASLVTALATVIPNIIKAAKGNKRDIHELFMRELGGDDQTAVLAALLAGALNQ